MIQFKLEGVAYDNAKKFLDDHKKRHVGTANWIGSPFSFEFRNTGISTECTVKCNCGESVRVSDADDPDWMP